MTFLFEDIITGDTGYVSASDLAEALEFFDHLKESSELSVFEHVHVYVRIY